MLKTWVFQILEYLHRSQIGWASLIKKPEIQTFQSEAFQSILDFHVRSLICIISNCRKIFVSYILDQSNWEDFPTLTRHVLSHGIKELATNGKKAAVDLED